MRLILTGFKNAGKSTYGKLFALKKQYRFYDTDDLIKNRFNRDHNSHKTTRDIYQALGPDGFRDFESTTLMQTHYVDPAIIATGGGTMLLSRNSDHLKTLGKIVYLKVDAETLYQRLIAQDQLPAYISNATPQQDFYRMHRVREPIYESAADTSIDCTHLSDQAVMQALERIYANH